MLNSVQNVPVRVDTTQVYHQNNYQKYLSGSIIMSICQKNDLQMIIKTSAVDFWEDFILSSYSSEKIQTDTFEV